MEDADFAKTLTEPGVERLECNSKNIFPNFRRMGWEVMLTAFRTGGKQEYVACGYELAVYKISKKNRTKVSTITREKAP